MDLIDHESDNPLEEILNTIRFAWIVLFLILGCSSSNPILPDTSISNGSPVSGQRIFVQVNSVTDNPPMTYQWTTTAPGDALDVSDSTPYSAYWIAPETAGSYTLTCTVTDKDKKHITHNFNILVRPRALESNLVGTGFEIMTITKETEYKTGGIWASVRDNKIRFITSTTNEESVWGKNFFTMLNRTDPTTLEFKIWGVEAIGNNIIELTASSEKTLACGTCLNFDTIKTLAIDVNVLSTLWVGTDSGLNYYDSTSSQSWKNYFYGQVNDLSEGPDYVYAATSTGVYKLNFGKKEPIYGGDTCAVLAAGTSDAPEVWSVVQGILQKDGKQFSTQPPGVICSLDKDITGNIWCGKYWWDGSLWQAVPGLESVTIVKVVASMEGLTYLLSNSGVLYRW
jgi:hypothetical protein